MTKSTFIESREVTISEILDARESRARLQEDFIAKYGETVVSFTMNIAGPVKNTPLIERAFRVGLSELLTRLPEDKIIAKKYVSRPTGCEAMLSVALSADAVKEICVSIEESSRLGRLFDMDVIDPSGKKLDRMHERSCIVCGSVGRACASRRIHSAQEVFAVTTEIIREHFVKSDSQCIGRIAAECLIKEVRTTPKPGLVDLRNNGSHTDMDVDLFVKSACALEPYFAECVKIGVESAHLSPDETFSFLRKRGIEAEREMYAATNGVNTHKGVIYSIGVILGALGRLWHADRPIEDVYEILSEASELVKESVKSDLSLASGATAGERLYRELGLKGIRGEAASGFSSVVNRSLPVYKEATAKGYSSNDAGVLALINLISMVEDSNIYRRGGVSGAKLAKEYASRMLGGELDLEMIKQMDDDFIAVGISPGGSADLLAVTYLIFELEKLIN